MQKQQKVWNLLLTLALIGLCPGLVLAQTTTATISGTVQDETGGILPGVDVNVTNVGTGILRTVVSDDEGRYRVPELPPGDYEIQASLVGFQTVVRSGITLTVGRHAVVDVTLIVGSISEVVTVSGEASLVETTSSTLSGLVSETEIRDLPLNGRNFVQLTLLETGVVQARTSGQGNVTGAGLKMSIHGARMDFNHFVMDGTTMNSVNQEGFGGAAGQAMGVETIQEFQVLTSNFSAEFGRAGGGVINVVTKSGTNELHGSVFYFHRNDNLDATNWATNRANQEKPEFKRNQYGFSLGGPIVPDKTFIFGGYEGLRESLGRTLSDDVPTSDARLGIFPDETVAVDPAVLPYIDLWPQPNGRDNEDGTAEFVSSGSNVSEQDFYQVRVDHNLSDSDALFGRYTIDDSVIATPVPIPTWARTDVVRTQLVTIEHKKIFSPTLLNVFRVGYNRSSVASKQDPLDPRVFEQSLWWVQDAAVTGLGIFGVGGVGEPGGAINRPRRRLDNVFQYQNTVTYDRGSHSIKFGGDFQKVQTNEKEAFRGQGVFAFANFKTFLAANPRSFIGVTGESDFDRGWRQTLMSLFIQDDIQVRPNLTVNLGLRWEVQDDPTEVNGKAAHLVDPVTDTGSTVGNPLFKMPLDNFAPRIGLAWDPFSDGKTSIRFGFGMFHQMIFRNLYLSARLLPPFVQAIAGDAPGISFPHPLDGPVVNRLQVEGITFENNHNPLLMNYNLGVQRELFPNTVLTVSYVGSRGNHLGAFKDPNVAIPEICPCADDPGTPGFDESTLPPGKKYFTAGLSRRNPVFSQVRFKTLDANSWYNSLQLQVNRRLSNGLQVKGSYTWSHMTDNATGTINATFSSSGVLQQDPYDDKADYGHSALDVRHIFITNFTYALPVGRDLTGAAGTILGGWQVNGIVNVTSGPPFEISNNSFLDRDRDRAGGSNSRPNLVPGRSNNPVTGNPDQYFDPAAFELQEAGLYGDVGRNTAIGPGLATVDFGVTKDFLIDEQRSVQFRAEFFNIFNRANFALPNRTVFRNSSGVPSGTAGRITSTATKNRELQFGLKLIF